MCQGKVVAKLQKSLKKATKERDEAEIAAVQAGKVMRLQIEEQPKLAAAEAGEATTGELSILPAIETMCEVFLAAVSAVRNHPALCVHAQRPAPIRLSSERTRVCAHCDCSLYSH